MLSNVIRFVFFLFSWEGGPQGPQGPGVPGRLDAGDQSAPGHIVEQTNIYELLQNSNFGTDIDEVEKFLGCLMKIGIVNMPGYKMYWAQSTRSGPVADVLSRNQFNEIKKFIHVNAKSFIITDRNDLQ